MVFRKLLRNVTFSRAFCNIGLTSNFEILQEIPTTKQPTLSDIVTDNIKKYKEFGSSRNYIDRANEYLSSKPNLRILKDIIPASYFLKKSTKTKTRTFLVDNNVACDIFKVLQPHLKDYSGHVMEINAGAGVLTEELLKAGLQNLRIYEPDAILCNHLLELMRQYKSDARLFKANLLGLGRMIKFDGQDNLGRVESLFDGLPSFSWEDEPVVKVLGTMQNVGFILHIMFSIILQTGLCEFGRPELFIILSQQQYEKLKSKPSEEKLYRSNSVIFQVLFDHEVLLKVPEKAFIPWFKAPTPKRGKNQCNEADTDLCFLKLTPKKDLLQTIPPDSLRLFWFFVKFLMRKKSSLLIDKMENWIPGSGVRLISKGYTIFTDCGSLTPDQYVKIYLEFSSWPEFRSCSFLPSVESLLGKILQYSFVEQEVSDEKFNRLLDKESNVSDDEVDVFDNSTSLEHGNKNEARE